MRRHNSTIRIAQMVAIALLANVLAAGSCGKDGPEEERRTYEGYKAGGQTYTGEGEGEGEGEGKKEPSGVKQGGLDGPTSTTDAKAHKEVGWGRFAILLSDPASAGNFCWYVETTLRISSAYSKRTGYRHSCIDDETNCLLHEPDGFKRETSTSFVRVDYDTVSGGPLAGNCNILDAYLDGDPTVQCLYHKDCDGGQQCMDYLCRCPKGKTCEERGAPAAPSDPDGNSDGSADGGTSAGPDPAPGPAGPAPTAPAPATPAPAAPVPAPAPAAPPA